MEGIDGIRVEDARDADDGKQDDRFSEPGSSGQQDPAESAASVISDQALSIFQALEATTSEIEARARNEAEEIRKRTVEVLESAQARLDAVSRDLDALSTAVDHVAETRAASASGDG
jgi:hypothetical protein